MQLTILHRKSYQMLDASTTGIAELWKIQGAMFLHMIVREESSVDLSLWVRP